MNQQTNSLLEPSGTFRKQVRQSIIAIVSFIVVYFGLLALSLVLAGLAFYGGIAIISLRVTFLTVAAGAGLMGCGVMVLFFMIKFIFASHKEDLSDSIEITEAEQPELFHTIHELAAAVGTHRPKRIYLSQDVNAAVFYDSSFWSMFFPIKKNLKIGLGLVNSVNVSEFKAVIAHEFGHFSQKSMKVGSWVYGVNRIIYDMLYNNSSYSKALSSFGSVDGIIAIFTQITVKIVEGIMWVLQQMYKVVNKSYMALSREMEFHADLVAASVCGGNNVVNALKRIEFGQYCYSITIDLCNGLWQDKKVVADLYAQHSTVVKHFAPLHKIQLVNGLPVMKAEDDDRPRKRINYRDQWSSHPELADREAHLEPFGLNAPVDETPAWSLFRNAEKMKEDLTRVIYNGVSHGEIRGTAGTAEFESYLLSELNAFAFPQIFGKFYEGRAVEKFDPDAVANTPFTLQPFGSILTREAKLLPARLGCLNEDISVLQAIVNKQIEVSSFDFDGEKYPGKQAGQVLAQLEEEKAQLLKRLNELDTTLFRYFYAVQPMPEAEAYKASWKDYFQYRSQSEQFSNMVNGMMDPLVPIFRGQTLDHEDIQGRIDGLKETDEPLFKKTLQYWIAIGVFEKNAEALQQVEKFIRSDYAYFTGTEYFVHELNDLGQVVQMSEAFVSAWLVGKFIAIAERQAAIEEKRTEESGVPVSHSV
jgi:Zn-dependent protease with chaperone function